MTTASQLNSIREWTEQKKTLIWIGSQLGIDQRTVGAWCKKHKIPYKNYAPRGSARSENNHASQPKWDARSTQQLVELKGAGCSFEEIASEMGRTRRGVEAKMFRLGLAYARSGRTRKVYGPIDTRDPETKFAALMRGRLFSDRATNDSRGPMPSRPATELVGGGSSLSFAAGRARSEQEEAAKP